MTHRSRLIFAITLFIVPAWGLTASCNGGDVWQPDFDVETDAPDTVPDSVEDPSADDTGDVPDTEDPCEPGQVLCGDKCVDTDSDAEHCGACDNGCTAPANAGPTCQSGECGWSCVAGWEDADGNEANGCECNLSGANETQCGDDADNDCDGLVDCADEDCAGVSCGENALICESGACVCSLGEAPETLCGDGVDNDCDGSADCADGDCGNEVCGEATDLCCGTDCVNTLESFYHCGICDNDCNSGEVCSLGVCGPDCAEGLTDCGGSCVNTTTSVDHCGGCFESCPLRDNATRTCADSSCGYLCASGFFDVDLEPDNGCECHRTESAEATCGDLMDNDCDGGVDCDDADCDGLACSATGRVCQSGVCLCPGGEVGEITCNDSSDNDCDGWIDCEDLDCDDLACGPYGMICTGPGVCGCPGGETSELTCGDGLDNDCDGSADCLDTDCAGRGCGDVGELCCALGCVDTLTNSRHCGGCGIPCADTEACIDGSCSPVCTNDCDTGQRQCDPDGLNGYQICGNFDSDPCLEWSSTTLCSSLSECYAGQCIDPTPPGTIIINEVLYDGESGDEDDVFIELWGEPGMLLGGFNILAINGADGASYAHIDLFGRQVPADGYFVIVHPSANASLLAQADMQAAAADLQNGPDSVQLRWGDDLVVDALGYGDSGVNFAGEGTPAPDVSPARSLSRNRAHWDTDDNLTDFHSDDTPTPGRNEDPAYTVSSVTPAFVDISATGANTGLTGDDDYLTMPIGFDFPFFGNVYSTVLVHINGFVSFDLTGGLWYTNQQFPDSWDPNDVAACFWDDLYVRSLPEIDAVYTQLFPAAADPYLVVQYHDLDFFSSTRNPATLTFEIILYQSGAVECQYREMTSVPDPSWATGASATVGLENVDASDFLLHSYNDPSGVFSPGGLRFTPI